MPYTSLHVDTLTTFKLDNIGYKIKQMNKEYLGVHAVQLSPKEEFVAAGYGSGGILFHDAENGQIKQIFRGNKTGGFPITCIRFVPRKPHIFLAASSDGTISLCSTDTNTCKTPITENLNTIHGLDFNVDGSTFGTVGSDKSIRLYETSTLQLLNLFPNSCASPYEDMSNMNFLPHNQRIFAIKFHPKDPSIFVTSGWDRFLKFWDNRLRQGITNSVRGVHIACTDALDWKDNFILSGSWLKKNALQIHEYPSGNCVKILPLHNAHSEFLYCAKFCNDGLVLCGGSGTKSVQALNSKTGELVGEIQLSSTVHSLSVKDGGRKFAAGSNDTQLILGNMLTVTSSGDLK